MECCSIKNKGKLAYVRMTSTNYVIYRYGKFLNASLTFVSFGTNSLLCISLLRVIPVSFIPMQDDWLDLRCLQNQSERQEFLTSSQVIQRKQISLLLAHLVREFLET
jgi:hypothetical protein